MTDVHDDSRPAARLIRESRQHVVLRALHAQRETAWRGRPVGWVSPMFVGGSDQSHHARTLGQLVHLGLAQTRKLHAIYCFHGTLHKGRVVKGCCCKGSRLYCCTDAGRAELSRLELEAMAATPAPRSRAR